MLRVIEEALTFDDVLLVPAHSSVLPRDVSLQTRLTQSIQLNIPILSAAMDTVTEARLAIAMAQEGGVGILHKNMTLKAQAAMVSAVKKFESGVIKDPITVSPNTSIREVMTPRTSITAVEKETSLEEIKKSFIESGFSRIPVYTEKPDQIIGLVFAKDFLDYSKLCQSTLKDLLRPVEYVQEAQKLDDTLEDFRKKKIHMAIVQDEYGGTAGLVTMEDILEEIVGEIQDEFDEEEIELIQKQEDGSLILDPKAPIYDINELLDPKIPDDEFDNIGAFIYNITGDIPQKGTEVSCDYFDAIILEADERNITSIRLSSKVSSEESS